MGKWRRFLERFFQDEIELDSWYGWDEFRNEEDELDVLLLDWTVQEEDEFQGYWGQWIHLECGRPGYACCCGDNDLTFRRSIRPRQRSEL